MNDRETSSVLGALAFLAALSLASCQAAPPSSEDKHSPTSADQSLSFRSSVPDISIVATSALPRNVSHVALDDYCVSHAIIKPRTAGGRQVQAAQWVVTSETKLNGHDAVTFVRALEPATSSTCFHNGGNLALFDGKQLKAIAYSRHPDEVSIGYAEQIEPSRLRLWTGMPGAPFADVVWQNGMRVEPVASQDDVCGGQAVVPNVFSQFIGNARRKLSTAGWQPLPTSELGREDTEPFKRGVVEVEACAGTGFGFCAYNYRHAKGFGLRIISTGEDYRVTSYEAVCEPSKYQ